MQNRFQAETSTEKVPASLSAPRVEMTNSPWHDTDNTQAVPVWLAAARRQVRRNQIKTRAVNGGMGACALIPFVVRSSLADTAQYVLIGSVLLLSLHFYLRYRASAAKPIWSAEVLADVEGVEAIGTLIDLTSGVGANEDFDTLLGALTNLLPQVKAGDAGLLTAEQRSMLYRALNYGSNIPKPSAIVQNYLLAILKALEQIGDAAALPIVTRLANRRAVAGPQQEIRAAAQRCLPLLQMRLTEVEVRHTLLRGSPPESSAPEVLLRPAGFTHDANPDHLLKATDTGPLPPM